VGGECQAKEENSLRRELKNCQAPSEMPGVVVWVYEPVEIDEEVLFFSLLTLRFSLMVILGFLRSSFPDLSLLAIRHLL